MSVDVDKPGCNDPSSGFEDFSGIRRCDARLQSGDLSASDGDIHDAVEPLARVQYPSSLDHKVIFRCHGKRGAGQYRSGVEKLTSVHAGDYRKFGVLSLL